MTVQSNYIIYHLQYKCLLYSYILRIPQTTCFIIVATETVYIYFFGMEKVNSYCKTHERCQTADSGQTAVLIAASLINQGSDYITYHRRLSPWYKTRSEQHCYHPPSIDQYPSTTNLKIIEMKNVFFFFCFLFFFFYFFV